MKTRQWILKIVFSLLVLFNPSNYVYALNVNPVADFLCDQAKIYSDRGQISEAVQEYSKVLLLDPNNKTAKDSLRKLGYKQGLYRAPKLIDARPNSLRNSLPPGLSNVQSLKTIQIPVKIVSKKYSSVKAGNPPLNSELYSSGSQIGNFEPLNLDRNSTVKSQFVSPMSIKGIKTQLEQTQKQQNQLQQKVIAQNEDTQKQTIDLQGKIALLKDTVTDMNRKIDKLNGAVPVVDSKRSPSLTMKENWQDNFPQKDFIENEEILSSPASAEQKKSPKEVDQFQQLSKPDNKNDQNQSVENQGGKEDQDQLADMIKEKDRTIAGLKENLAQLKRKVLLIEKNTQDATNNTTKHGETQLRDSQLDLSEKDFALKEKETAILELQQRIDELSERQDLSQQILQEKESQIKKLTEDLQSALDQCK